MDPVTNIVKASGNFELALIVLGAAMALVFALASFIVWQYRVRNRTQQATLSTLATKNAELAAGLAEQRGKASAFEQRIAEMLQKDERADRREGMLQQKVSNFEQRIEMQERNIDRDGQLLERRLSAGSEKFKALETQIEELKKAHNIELTSLVTTVSFAKYCEDHGRDHERIEKQLGDLQTGQQDIVRAVEGLGGRLESGLKTVSSIVSNVVTLDDKRGKRKTK